MSLMNGRPGSSGPSRTLSEFTLARYVRIRMRRIRIKASDERTLSANALFRGGGDLGSQVIQGLKTILVYKMSAKSLFRDTFHQRMPQFSGGTSTQSASLLLEGSVLATAMPQVPFYFNFMIQAWTLTFWVRCRLRKT